MTRDLFLNILKHNLIGPLLFIIVVYLFYWWLMLSLGCRILNVKINLWLAPAVLFMLGYCFVVRWYIPPIVYGLLQVVLVALILKISGGSACSIPRVLWSSMSIILLSALGDIFILSPAYLHRKFAEYLLHTPNGMAIGGLLETIFPFLAYIALPHLKKLSLIPASKKSDRYEIYAVVAYGLMYCSIYFSFLTLYIGVLHNAKYLFMYLILLWITTIGVILCYHIVIKLLNKRIEMQQKRHEEELRQNQEKIDILTKMYERLKFMKVDQEIVDEVFNSAKKLEEYGRVLDAKKEFNFLFEKVLDGIEFTETEIKIMKLIVEGKSNREIGEILCFSESHIGNMISKIYAKAGINDRATLAAYYVIRSIFMNI